MHEPTEKYNRMVCANLTPGIFFMLHSESRQLRDCIQGTWTTLNAEIKQDPQ